ncbi:MAG TPA: GEVED domain-containing protein, partial [Thermoanaerobaculia bacterium]|nr:GEVED domain-containing protein [Thermoanaerobaculia bacterium]
MVSVGRGSWCAGIAIAALVGTGALSAQPLQKAAIQVDPGNTKLTGQTFGYRLTYQCNATVGNCLNAVVTDVLPPEVVFVSAVGTSDVASTTTPSAGSTGTVTFTLINPLPAGNSGDLIINVRFPNGSTPNGTVATNTATGTNLATPPGSFTTPAVAVTAVSSSQVTLDKSLLTSPANLDMPESYRLRISVSGNPGSLNLTAVGPVTDTLPTGTVFNGATPAADCQPGCVGTTPATVTWTSPCGLPVAAGGNCDITVNVTFPSATFPSGTNVTNSFTAAGTPLGQPANPSLGVGSVTHPVTTFVPSPSAGLAKDIEGSSPNPPTLNQTFSYNFAPSNNGNLPLDSMVVIDTLPIELQVSSVTTGAYSGLADFAAGEGVRVSYEKNTAPGVFTLWGSSPNTTTSTTLTAPPPGLGAGEYLTKIRWEYGQAAAGMSAFSRPLITGKIVNPNNAGGPVAFGNTIHNCVALTAVYTAGPTNVSQTVCRDFVLSGPFVQLNPAKENLSGGPFLPGQSVAFRLRVRSAPQSSDPVPLQFVISTDLLPVDMLFSNWTFDDRGTGLPAPQVFDQIPNFAGTGRTLLRWRWNAGSGNLGVNQEVWINISTTVRNGAVSGSLANDFTLEHDAPGFSQRCSGSSVSDPLDYDSDANTAETLCRGTGTITIAPVAQLISNKRVQGDCDGGFTAASLGTLLGGSIDYRLLVQNVGTIPMNNFVIVDILPFVGDTGVLDTNPRNSLWAPILTAPITAPPGTTLSYSLSGNPCRPEVGVPNTGCDPPNWTTAAPVPISLARSFKVEFSARTIQPFDFLTFDFRMTVPAGTPTGGQQAFNSFAYLGARADGIGNLSVEPNKVGVAIGACPAAALGDFVWLDSNRNGLQDDGPTGVNGVFVELLAPGADGIARTADDFLVSTTVTANDVSNQPGWYQFPGLAAGTYFVRFTPPPNLEVTLRDAGGDAIDSDVDPVTACSPVVVLGPTDSNQTIDMGLVPPVTAALGNYVFFDIDNDGLQDGPADFGVNGVAVKLFADNGNGTPEPGGADGSPVAITATANDVFGQPGYYLFENLLPGVKYFVQFMLPPTATGFTTRDAGGDDTQDSDANTGNGTSPLVMLMSGETNLTIDAGLVRPSGTLRLGNQVWMDNDNDGVFEPQNGEMGIDGVRLDLYLDANGDGMPTLDEYVTTTATFTANGFAGRYEFAQLAPGNYLVVVPASNFLGSGPLAGKQSSTGNDPAPDPDDDVNGDDNGTPSGSLVASRPVTLSSNGEPTTDGDTDANSNLTVDFGFTAGATPPEFDYGDDPDVVAGAFSPTDYQTTALDAGAAHRVGVINAPYLGSCVDADPGTQQSTAANADDANSYGTTVGSCAFAGDDEDGVSFANPLRPGSPVNIAVTASSGTSPCTLSAWIDWNRDGDFLDAGEQIATAVSVPSGTTTNLNPTVPAGARPGLTYSRFRCASAPVAGPTGMAPDGEVEDYLVAVVGMDFGDAPDSYGTTIGANGPRHNVDPNAPLTLGSCEDTEADGQPGASALGDDNAQGNPSVGLCFDDEDGVAIPMLVACQNAAITVTVGGPAGGGRLDAWIDWNRNGTIEITEPIATNLAVVPGTNVLNVSVPCDANPGTAYARFRLSTAGNLPPTGAAADGEVEDYTLLIKGSDWGDAPAPYPTLAANNGPNHGVDPAAPRFLGSCVDTEANGQPTIPADGDDLAAGPAVGTCTANDDEDGVVFATPLIGCQAATVTVTANVAGRLDAWIDWDRDGDWLDAGEQIAANLALAAGANPLALSVPCGVNPGATYARFRTSSTGGLSSTGAAMDGEVEDHRVILRGGDFGDLADTFGTTFAAGGPNHGVDTASTLRLGVCVDTEIDGQPTASANGDDGGPGTSSSGTCTLEGDEDGVIFLDVRPAACQTARLLVTTGAVGLLDAWFDFDGNGSFGDDEQIFDNRALAAGANNLTFNVPCSAVPGLRGTRFRFSSTGVVGPGGPSPDGEVEDYVVTVKGVDFGDAPDSYGTSHFFLGPNHGVDPFIPRFLGSCVDTESDASLPFDGGGDDGATGAPTGTCAVPGDDEDGVAFSGLPSACLPFDLTVTANVAGRLDAWIDWNHDGDFLDTGEQIAASRLLAAGANPLHLTVPCDVPTGGTYARFRFSSAGGLPPTGPAADGEVEDYRLIVQGADFGDAPDSYGTTLASGGPFHSTNLFTPLVLGRCVDEEPDAQTPLDGSGDDLNGAGAGSGFCANGDEDGFLLPRPKLIPCQAAQLSLAAVPAAGLLDAWIDWNRDGDFLDAEERIATARPIFGSENPVLVEVPCTAVAGPSFARFRLSSAGVSGPTGSAPDGEVEDYAVTIEAVDGGDAPDSYGTLFANNGPSHGRVPGFSLGAAIDGEPDGQPTPGADGDDVNGLPDDEDGVDFNTGAAASVTACGTTNLTVTLSLPPA